MGKVDEDGKTGGEDFSHLSSEARRFVWMGAIPLLVQLHDSEVTSLPGPLPHLVLAPRNGYLPLLADIIKPHFQSTLPPGSDTVWFDYEGLPLKWHIPTGVLFDLLCAEPERPWKLTVHFRSYPSEVLSPCEGEDSVKWNFVNALKEAAYVMYGSTKSVMNLSQLEQSELWKSVVKGDLDSYDHIFGRIKPGIHLKASAPWNLGGTTSQRLNTADSEIEGKMSSRDLVLTLRDVLMKVVPHLFSSLPLPGSSDFHDIGESPRNRAEGDPAQVSEVSDQVTENEKLEAESGETVDSAAAPFSDVQSSEVSPSNEEENEEQSRLNAQDPESPGNEPNEETRTEEEKSPQTSAGGLWEGLHVNSAKQFQGIVRVQGIEPNLDIPLDWVARNLCGPEMFVHLCICTWVTR